MVQAGAGWEVPDRVRSGVEFHWFHVPATGSLAVAVLSNEPVWYVGHFEKGRMRECDGPECELCARGVGTQLRYVLCVADLTTRQVGVIEVGSGVAALIKQWSVGLGYLRGMCLEVAKCSRSKHSRMEVELIHERPPGWVMSTEPLNVRLVLERTWDRIRGGA